VEEKRGESVEREKAVPRAVPEEEGVPLGRGGEGEGVRE